ncbi:MULTISPECIES: hypothetical protein [unclassified Streptomyces]|uniref:hypothetical protein n=1 Tax=unclassified Streptomyces TaxID=2593676 RepID=UPI002E2A224D|nr:hypothetical protein [Streptomyces sp. NBC_01429]
MHSDPALEKRPVARGRRRKRGSGPQEGPVFVDASGRRSRLLRRAGILFGVVCIGYVAVLGLAFMGGISLTPSEISPFGGGPAAAGGGGGNVPPGEGPPPGTGEAPPSAPPSGQPSAAASASPSASTGSGN